MIGVCTNALVSVSEWRSLAQLFSFLFVWGSRTGRACLAYHGAGGLSGIGDEHQEQILDTLQ